MKKLLLLTSVIILLLSCKKEENVDWNCWECKWIYMNPGYTHPDTLIETTCSRYSDHETFLETRNNYLDDKCWGKCDCVDIGIK